MKTSEFFAKDRGSADFGWLKANYSFSFARYYDPKKTHFGKLRVLNDDTIEGGSGFSKHPHENMEIITIPLKGALAHKDSTGGKGVIRPNEVQVMSAGTGVEHSEYNHLDSGETKMLQIWIFPDKQNIAPRYEQQFFDEIHRLNQWQPIVSNLHPGAMKIQQNAVLSRVKLEKKQSIDYEIHYSGNGVYLFVIEGEIEFNNKKYRRRDAIGIEQSDLFTIFAAENSELLAIEVPMN